MLRRTVLALTAIVAALVSNETGAQTQTEPASDFTIVTLGTGSPPPVLRRFGPATLVRAGQETLLFDAGRGVTQRLFQVGIRLGSIDALFITHLHSDHVVGIPDLWLTGWLSTPYAQRQTPFRVWGPQGTKGLMAGLEQAYARDIQARIADQDLKKAGVATEVVEIREGVVYERNGVKVTAFEVDHGPLLKPAFGYRVDYDGRSVVISGAVYYHIVLQGSPQFPAPTEDDIVRKTRTTYSGPLVVSEDLMTFNVAKTGVTTAPPKQ